MAARQKGVAMTPMPARMPASLGTPPLGVGIYRLGGKLSKLSGGTNQLEGDNIS